MTSRFADLEQFVALPRIEGITVCPDGSRVALTLTVLDADGTGASRSIWAVPRSAGTAGALVRLTRSRQGDGGAVFTRSGDLLFLSGREDADAPDASGAPQLWTVAGTPGETSRART